MATTTVLSNTVSVVINSVDLSDQVTNATINQQFDELETTSMGSTSRVFVKGLESSTITLDFLNSYVASEVYATLQAAYGTSVTCVMKPTTAAVSSTNPSFTASILINNLTPINGGPGDLSTQSITFTCTSTVAIATS